MKIRNGRERKIARLEGELGDLEASLEARYSLLGRSLLELIGNEERAVNRLVDQIVKKKRQLALARREKQCADCQAFSPGDSHFCRQCGAPLDGE
ncbi:hypothetical protein LJC64_03270 [Ruminococcaceae bacterium OttesenSCG-928-A11]|nr:hypothetical protein [Ruminococcaceae bacterium OttesenSCG-928-A11]